MRDICSLEKYVYYKAGLVQYLFFFFFSKHVSMSSSTNRSLFFLFFRLKLITSFIGYFPPTANVPKLLWETEVYFCLRTIWEKPCLIFLCNRCSWKCDWTFKYISHTDYLMLRLAQNAWSYDLPFVHVTSSTGKCENIYWKEKMVGMSPLHMSKDST